MTANVEVLQDVAQLVLDCVSDTLNTNGPTLPFAYAAPCRQYVSPGPPAWETCCETNCGGSGSQGQLTVHINEVFESTSFPSPSAPILPCAPSELVVSLTVTVVRCGPSQDDTGGDPAAEALTQAAAVGHADLMGVLQAFQCCVTASPPGNRTSRRVRIDRMNPIGEQGGCTGWEVSAFVATGDVCVCDG